MSSLLRSSISVNSTSPSTTSSTNWNETETLATIVFGIIAIFVSAATIWQGHRMWKVRGQRHPHSNPEDTIRSSRHTETLFLQLVHLSSSRCNFCQRRRRSGTGTCSDGSVIILVRYTDPYGRGTGSSAAATRILEDRGGP